MKLHNLVQGSPEWHQFRLEHFGASEAAPMLGLSANVKRTELLHMKHTGTPKEYSEWLQKNILDHGHVVEAQARPLIEAIIGEELYPVTCSDGKFSASCDGLTMDERIAFEHKQWNERLAACVRDQILPNEHIPQCQQILMITGAEKVIFTVSDGTPDNLVHMDVLPDPAWWDRIRAGWDRFEKDLAEYVPVVIPDKPQPAAIMQLPTLAIQIRGEVITSNLPAFARSAQTFLSTINMNLKTDEDFANAEETVKFCERAEKELDASKAAVIGQTATIDEVMRTIDYVKEQLRAKRLSLDKLVKTQKEAIKASLVSDARMAFAVHVRKAEEEIDPIRLVYPHPDFQAAIKNKRTLASLHDAINSTLANSKIEIDAIAQNVRRRLAWCRENVKGYGFLFADLQTIIYKADDDFQRLANDRIETHKAETAAKAEAQRIAMQAEADRLAELRARAKLAASTAATGDAPHPPRTGEAEAPKPVLIKTETRTPPAPSRALVLLARHDAAAFRQKYAAIRELAEVMQAIDGFLATPEDAVAAKG